MVRMSVGHARSPELYFDTRSQTCLDRATTSGYAFISADYQLMPPATGHAVTKDIQDLLRFIANTTIWFPSDPNIVNGSGLTKFSFNIDSEAIAVAGSSAGGLCAYLAAMHCVSPKPKAILSLYGQGGDFLVKKKAK